MKKRKNTKFKTDDKIVTLICTIGILTSLLCYFTDIYRVNQRSDTEPIATLTEKVKSVQRRFRDRLVWDMLRSESPLYEGDFVRTGAYSEAIITFNSGTVLSMSQDSFVEILPETETMNLRFTSGNISIKAAKKTIVTAGTETLELEKGTVLAMNIVQTDDEENDEELNQTDSSENNTQTEENKSISFNKKLPVERKHRRPNQTAQTASFKNRKMSISIQEGNIKQNKNNGEIVNLNAGSQLVINEDGIESKEPSIIMLQPLPMQKIVHDIDDHAEISFKWKNINYNEDTTTKLELAYDKKFEYPFETITTSETEDAIFEVPNKTFYWRAYPVISENSTIDPASIVQGVFSVYTAVPIKKLQPVDGFMYSYQEGKKSIRFSWTSDDLAESYKLTVSQFKNMENPVITEEIVGTSATLSGFESGLWYWNITPVYSETAYYTPKVSEPNSFSIMEKPLLQKIALQNPTDEEEVFTSNGRQPILFKWQMSQNAITYTLQIADNEKMKSPIVNIDCTQTYQSIAPGKYGITEGKTWYWRVFYKNKDGTVSPSSDIRTFKTMN